MAPPVPYSRGLSPGLAASVRLPGCRLQCSVRRLIGSSSLGAARDSEGKRVQNLPLLCAAVEGRAVPEEQRTASALSAISLSPLTTLS